MDSELAKSILRAILSRAKGQVGTFVDLRELAAMPAFAHAKANATITELLTRRWIDRKGDCISVSKPGVEYAIDWTLADRVLQAIARIADSRGGAVIPYSQVLATVGLPRDKTEELMSELAVLGLAARTTLDRASIDGAYISCEGLSRLAVHPTVT